MDKISLRNIANDTINILKEGHYTKQGVKYFLPPNYKNNSELYDENIKIDPKIRTNLECNIQIGQYTTLDTIIFFQENGLDSIGVLNFASGKKPGGGFLNGAQAQEESLARSSTLYFSLISDNSKKFYENNSHYTGGYYENLLIYSKKCYVFKDDSGDLLDEPIQVDFVSIPAPNAGVIWNKKIKDVNDVSNSIFNCLILRIKMILTAFINNGIKNIILGAFGCGVFKNNPKMVAQSFYIVIVNENFAKYFENIYFAIIDKSMEFIFRKQFNVK